MTIAPGFPFLLLLFALAGEEALLAALLLAAALHEMGHYIALRLFCVKVTGLRLSAFGARMDTAGRQRLSYGRELVTLLAGPFMNALCAVLTTALAEALSWAQADLYIGAHIILGGFNLLPILPLDGGRAVGLALSFFLGPVAGERLVCAISMLSLAALAGGAVYLTRQTGGDGWLLLGVAGLAGTSLRELGMKVSPCKSMGKRIE